MSSIFPYLRRLGKLLACIAVLHLGNSAPAMDSQSILAVGSLRGYVESCGCSPETNYGGLRRLNRFVNLERSRGPVLLVNLGDNLGQDARKNKLVLETLAVLNPVASLPEKQELEINGASKDRLNLLLSVGRKPYHKKTPLYRIVGNSTFFGVQGPLSQENLNDLIRVVRKTPEKNKKILLIDSDLQTLERS